MVLRLFPAGPHEPTRMIHHLPRAAVLAAATLCTTALCTSSLSAQTTVSIVADKDNTLYEDINGAFSNALGDLFVGRNAFGQGGIRRALLHFDVAGNVPAGAVVLEAELVMEITNAIASQPDVTTFHRVTQDWGEGTSGGPAGGAGSGGGFGAPSTTGDATWLHTFYSTSTWTTPGGDFAPTASFNMVLPVTPAPMQSLQTSTANQPGLIADVQDMLDDDANNFGWLMNFDTTAPSWFARRLGSRESAGVKPTLNVTYLLPGEATRVGVGCPVGAGTSELDFVGPVVAGTNVTIQRTNSVPSSIGADFFSLYIDPVGLPLQPGCTVYLPLAQELLPGGAYLTGAAGSSSAPFAVFAGYPGFLISCQSAVLDSSPFGLSLSNAAVMILP